MAPWVMPLWPSLSVRDKLSLSLSQQRQGCITVRSIGLGVSPLGLKFPFFEFPNSVTFPTDLLGLKFE